MAFCASKGGPSTLSQRPTPKDPYILWRFLVSNRPWPAPHRVWGSHPKPNQIKNKRLRVTGSQFTRNADASGSGQAGWHIPIAPSDPPLPFSLSLLFIPDKVVETEGRERERERGRDVGVLSDLAASDGGHGDFHAQVLRRPGGPSLRPLHRRIHLVLLSLHHHPRPRWHLGGTFLPSWFHAIAAEFLCLWILFHCILWFALFHWLVFWEVGFLYVMISLSAFDFDLEFNILVVWLIFGKLGLLGLSFAIMHISKVCLSSLQLLML